MEFIKKSSIPSINIGSNITDYSESASYKLGDLCFFENILYKAKGTTSGIFDETKWEKIGAIRPATETDLGGVIVGKGLEIKSNGVLSSKGCEYTQVNISNSTTKTVTLPITNTKTYCLPPVEVLKFTSGGTAQETSMTFDVADKDSFDDNAYVEFDGTMHEKTKYDLTMSNPAPIGGGYTSESEEISVNDWKNIEDVSVETDELLHLKVEDGNIVDKAGNTIITYGTINTVAGQVNDEAIDINRGYIDVTNSKINIPANTPFTISLWIKFASNQFTYTGAYSVILGMTDGSRGDSATWLEIGIQRGEWEHNRSNICFIPTAGIGLATEHNSLASFAGDNKFHHIAITRDKDNNVRTFIDGIKQVYAIAIPNVNGEFIYSGEYKPYTTDNISRVGSDGRDYKNATPGILCFDDFVILKGKALYTSDFTPPTKPYAVPSTTYLDGDNLYSINNNSLNLLSSTYSSLTDAEKENLIANNDSEYFNLPIFKDKSVTSFKVLAYSDRDTKPTTTMTAVPITQAVKPKSLISIKAYEGIESISITNAISGSGVIKMAVTTDLVNYYIYDTTTSSWVTVNATDIISSGMTPTEIVSLTRTEWDKLTTKTGVEGIAFAYALDISSTTDKAEVDDLKLNVELKGSWNKAVHGTDYTYGYPFNDTLKVNLLTDGTYKVNYSK